MRVRALAAGWLLFAVFGTAGVWGQGPDGADIQNLLRRLDHAGVTEPPRIHQTGEGYLRYIGAPVGAAFTTETSEAKATVIPEDVADEFMTEHKGAFGSTSGRVRLNPSHVHAAADRAYVHLRQTYDGLEVFGGGAVVHVMEDGRVGFVISDILRDTSRLDTNHLSLTPSVAPNQAQMAAMTHAAVQSEHSLTSVEAGEATLMVYEPAVVGNAGATRLVWDVTVTAQSPIPYMQRMFIDAHDGEVVFDYNLVHTIKDRRIYNANRTENLRVNLQRAEGDPPTGISEMDNAYIFIGNTYDFYFEHHGRDSLDDNGIPLHTTVNFGEHFNAFFVPGLNDILIGPGAATDDITAHEYTHGVTSHTSDLIYFNQSGAINESFSDMWGEFVDLTNGLGDDRPEVRWLIGEDSAIGAIRNMADPTQFGHPDRLNSPFFFTGFFNNGGVHINSGIGNKLCSLLVDGGEFNGFTIQPMGIVPVAKLFYETQFILTPASDYFDLFAALAEASANLGLTTAQRANVRDAVRAVEIEPLTGANDLRNVRALPARGASGEPLIVVQWRVPPNSSIVVESVVRNPARFPQSPTDGQILDLANAVTEPGTGIRGVVDGLPGSLLAGDGRLNENQEYFYTIFWNATSGFPGVSFARAVAGGEVPDFLTEVFVRSASPGANQPFDLQFSQLLISPVIDPAAAAASGQPARYVDFTNYTASLTRNVSSFPVPRGNDAFELIHSDNGAIQITFEGALFPYFGRMFSRAVIGANGYIDFGLPCVDCSDNFPSLLSHANNPRISFLFADLGFSIGGQAWDKVLDDRYVLTYEGVPEFQTTGFGFPLTNAVQLELFFSGHIRITYGEVNVSQAVVGLSDGQGIIAPLSFFVPGTPSQVTLSDLSALPIGDPNRLTIWPPVPVQQAIEGQTVRFVVTTNSPNEQARLSATWDGPGAVPFADLNDGSGLFQWTTDTRSAGMTNVVITARTPGGEVASQVVPILVADGRIPPEARSLRILAEGVDGDPAMDRRVPPDTSLMAAYEYFHPDRVNNPQSTAEGNTTVQWFRNGAAIPSLFNTFEVPARATQIGDVWWFAVRPRTVVGVTGELFVSPRVTIAADPVVDSISPNRGNFMGGTTVRIAGRHLSNVLSVTFNGFPVVELRVVSDEEIEVITPAGQVGPANVTLSGSVGSTSVRDGFTYISTPEMKAIADINGDGVVDALDVQLVIDAVLNQSKNMAADTNRDGYINAADVQIVVNVALAP